MSRIEKYIFFDGPFTDPTRNPESPYWTVYVAEDPISLTNILYTIYNYERAYRLVQAIARDQKLQILSFAHKA